MNYGVIPTDLSGRLALAFGKVPIPLLDSLYGILKARALMAGVRLGVFEALSKGPEKSNGLAPMVPAGSMESFGYILWNYHQWDMVARLDDAVRCGRGLDFHSTLKDRD